MLYIIMTIRADYRKTGPAKPLRIVRGVLLAQANPLIEAPYLHSAYCRMKLTETHVVTDPLNLVRAYPLAARAPVIAQQTNLACDAIVVREYGPA